VADDPADLAALRLAVAVADTGDLATAGASIGIGKRTAAARIAQLERRVGALLFDHAGKTIRLTPAGEAFIGEARLALAAIERAGRLARATAGRPETIPIGVASDALFGPIRDLVEDPAWAEAGLAPELHMMPAEDQIGALADGRLVMGFATPPVGALPRLEQRIVATSKWSAVVPDAEARLRKTVSLANLTRKPLVMLAHRHAPLALDGLIAALRATGAEPYIAQRAEDWVGVAAMVALGLGSALVPSTVAKRMAVVGATVLPLVEANDLPAWPTACIWLPQPPGSRGAAAITLVKARFG
jgi:DNA-binding transcriptional LysR family regulator